MHAKGVGCTCIKQDRVYLYHYDYFNGLGTPSLKEGEDVPGPTQVKL